MSSPDGPRVAIVTDANTHLGPDLARELAGRGHRLVLGEADPQLVTELESAGCAVASVTGVADLTDPRSVPRLVDTALERWGRLDAACIRTGRIILGSFRQSTLADLRTLQAECIESTFHALQALLPPMVAARSGQIVIVTSATGGKPHPNVALYSATRAAANMLVKNAALDVAEFGVTVNAVGTNNFDYPGFRRATGADDPEVRQRIEARIPIRRLGRPAEVAHFVASLLDGRNSFQTGQFFPLDGGWSV